MAVNFEKLTSSSDKLFQEPYAFSTPTISFAKVFKKAFDKKKLRLEGEIFSKESGLNGRHCILLKGKEGYFKQDLSEEGDLSFAFGYKPSFVKPCGLFGELSSEDRALGINFKKKDFSGSFHVNAAYVVALNLLGKYKNLSAGINTELSPTDKYITKYDACFRYKEKTTEVLFKHITPESPGGLGELSLALIKSLDGFKLGFLFTKAEEFRGEFGYFKKLKEHSAKLSIKCSTELQTQVNFTFKASKHAFLGVNYSFGIFGDSPFTLGLRLNIK